MAEFAVLFNGCGHTMALPDKDADHEYHHRRLLRHCCICLCPFKDKPYRYACTTQEETFGEGVGITITTDYADIHPPSPCNNCFSKKSTVDVYKWEPHTALNCTMCKLFKLQSTGGRPKRERKNRGLPKENMLSEALQDIEEAVSP